MRKRIIPRQVNPPDYVPRARNTDPWTSHVAAEPWNDVMKAKVIRPNKKHHLVLSTFEFATDGLNAAEAAHDSGYKFAWKRFSELERFGLLRCTGVPRTGDEGMPQLVWLITEDGLRALRRLDAGKTWPPTR